MLTELQYRWLRKHYPGDPGDFAECSTGESKLRLQLGDDLFAAIQGKTVVDFGCGEGSEAIEMARAGAAEVIGVDIREDVLQTATARARDAGLSARCKFQSALPKSADVVVSLDAFEHFANPPQILEIMNGLLADGGQVLISFGPTWYHPLGGHLFSVFPWAHLLLSEKALIQWRSDFKTDGATRFSEVAGGLNQMTIRRFEQMVKNSPFVIETLETVPIRRLRPIHNRLTREFTTAVVRCRLIKRGRSVAS
ncbi:MAG TPA: class I SAM-dependent methyltransferase [Bryobacteraceae bacterium]|nr:class I SAM-dependent methyltransferase [Bryobacteraceae bacterium]